MGTIIPWYPIKKAEKPTDVCCSACWAPLNLTPGVVRVEGAGHKLCVACVLEMKALLITASEVKS